MQLSPIEGADGAPLLHARPCVSRRMGGLVLDVDFNPTHRCNWRCVYCDVEDLTEGDEPDFDLARLEADVARGLEALRDASWRDANAPEGAREPQAVVISGSGEPTTLFEFHKAVEVVCRLAGAEPLRLLTNGSRSNKPKVREGLSILAEAGGEVWFKLDSATREGQERTNGNDMLLRQMRENLRIACNLAPTWIQTCVFARNGEPMSADEQEAYLSFLANQLRARVRIRGVLLNTPDRPSRRPEAAEIAASEAAWMEELAERIRQTGLEVRIAS